MWEDSTPNGVRKERNVGKGFEGDRENEALSNVESTK